VPVLLINKKEISKMNKREELIRNWNGGIFRCAQSKLAKALGVSTPTITRWVKGDLIPSEIQVKKMSRILKKPEEEIKEIFNVKNKVSINANNNRNIRGGINQVVYASDMDILKKDMESVNLKLDLLLEKLKK
jgi:predicted transcriptional regulator